MGCLGSWEPSLGSLWLGWPPMRLTEMGESPRPLTLKSLLPWSDLPHLFPLWIKTKSSARLHLLVHSFTHPHSGS